MRRVVAGSAGLAQACRAGEVAEGPASAPRRLEEETAALQKKQATFQRDRDSMQRADEEQHEMEVEQALFKVRSVGGLTSQRLRMGAFALQLAADDMLCSDVPAASHLGLPEEEAR